MAVSGRFIFKDFCIIFRCRRHAGIKGHDRADTLMDTGVGVGGGGGDGGGTITSGFCLERAELLRS